MIPGEPTIFRSPLDKPLGLLTEDDISQLTREDCRRYLKEKGMRRPSWNKSQAIEQVISLKSLLETRTESDAGGEGGILRQRIINVPPQPPEIPTQVISSNTETDSVPSTEKEKATSADLQVNESVSFRRKDPPKSGVSGDLSTRLPPVSSDTNTASLRNMRATTGSVGQMTIFYCGEVNVYDGMSADKARFIMQLAASPSDFPQDTPLAGTSAVQPLPCRSQAASAKIGLTSTAVSPTLQSVPDNSRQYWEEGTTFREAEPEGPSSRKASLQRYLEKRKDRGKFKIKKKIVGSSSNLEMYLNHQMRGQNSNEQSSPSGTCSPPQPRPPHTPIRCNSLENQADNMALSVDLNSNEVIEV